MPKKETTKAVTARFPYHEYLLLLQAAEQRGCTIAEVIRDAWSEYQQQHQVKQQLMRLEQRQRKTTFEMLCTVIGLQANERKQAFQQLQERGVKW